MSENYIPRMYNYNLETGTVGTDNEDISNILYNINRMEMKAALDTDDLDDMREAFSEAYSMTIDSFEHFSRFTDLHKDTLNPEDVDTVQLSLSEAVVVLDDVEPPQTDIELMARSIETAYKKMLESVPSLLQLEEQSL